MQSIITRYHGATQHRSSRISARTTSGIIKRFGYDYEKSEADNHKRAAEDMARQLGWSGTWHGGALDSRSEVWVRQWHDSRDSFTVAS